MNDDITTQVIKENVNAMFGKNRIIVRDTLMKAHLDLMRYGDLTSRTDTIADNMIVTIRTFEYKGCRYLDIMCNGDMVSITIH